MRVDEYLAAIPDLHTWDGGRTWNSGGFGPRELRAFVDLTAATPGARVIETGAGNSTIAFLLGDPSLLVSIAPDPALFGRIIDHCRVNAVDTGSLDARDGRSEWILPQLAAGGVTFDLALIDGGHGWPHPFVDFCYLNHMLRRGGHVVVDDVQLHSIKELARWLAADPRFTMVTDLGKSLVFRKETDAGDLGEWNDQPYITQRTDAYRASADQFSLTWT